MPSLRRLCTLGLPAALVVACSSGGTGAADPTVAPTAPTPTTSPFEVVTVDDEVLLGPTGIVTTAGVQLLGYTPTEQACIDATVATTSNLSASIDPGATDPLDPDGEQTLAQIVVGCVPFPRIQPVVGDLLATQEALGSVDRACLDRETDSLQDTPDALAAVLRGDPQALSVIASTAASNCR